MPGMDPVDTLLTEARLPDGRTGMAVACAGGRIAAILSPGIPLPPAAATHALGGQLLLSGLTDGHLHLDKTLMGLPWMPHAAGPTRASRIETDQRLMPHLPLPPAERASNLIRRCVAHGTALIRTHADITPTFGLSMLEGILEAKARHAGEVRIQTALLHKWPEGDSSRESSVIAGRHEQTDTADLQDQELACLQRRAQATRLANDLARSRDDLGSRADR